MSAVLLQGNPTFCVVDDKTNTDGEEDEGIDCPSGTEVSLDQSLQITPPSAPECVSLSDSGFQKSNTSGVDLRCLEGVWEWPSTRKVRDAQCSCADQEHDGFEDYVHEIFTHRLSIENKYHVKSCLNNQPEISPDVRKMLIHWLTSVHHDLALCQDTLYLAVHVFDRVLDVMQVSRDCLELLGITCLLVASKQNEICPPEIHELLEKCNETYTREQVQYIREQVQYTREQVQNTPENWYNTPENWHNTPENWYNTPENKYNTPENKYNIPENRYNIPENRNNTPENMYNTPENWYNTPEARYNIPEDRYNTPENKYNTPENKYNTPENKYNIPENRYNIPENRNKTPENMYNTPENWYNTPEARMARAMGRCALELSLQEYELCQFPPSMLALCVWNVAVETLRTTLDTRTVHYTRDIPAHQLETCFTHVHMFFDSFRQSGQDMSLLCEKYGNLYIKFATRLNSLHSGDCHFCEKIMALATCKFIQKLLLRNIAP
ncbi:CCNOB-like protein [Mya arenaria]|uniref:CCNOB-like protein n=1 Tax=Mya arenaria TaxID=6604 RepID=A0ABY7DT31_MYAAR|nr:CCNOB-like protein [Mya arenaria]